MGDEDQDGFRSAYYDGDDGAVRGFGRAADRGDARAIVALVKRYYAAAAAQDGARACKLTYYIEAESIPEEYGRPPGPLWLRGADTCGAVLSRVFAHFHNRLLEPVEVMAVRVSGSRAEVLVGFKTLPAGVVNVRREGYTWKVDGLLALALS